VSGVRGVDLVSGAEVDLVTTLSFTWSSFPYVVGGSRRLHGSAALAIVLDESLSERPKTFKSLPRPLRLSSRPPFQIKASGPPPTTRHFLYSAD
jgi:hypothetical protein